MKTKKEIVDNLVQAYEYHVRMEQNCKKWEEESTSELEKIAMHQGQKRHANTHFELSMLLRECKIPHTDAALMNLKNVQIRTH